MIISVPTGTLTCSKPAPEKVRLVKVPPAPFIMPESCLTFGVALDIVRGFIPEFVTRLFDAIVLVRILQPHGAAVFVCRG